MANSVGVHNSITSTRVAELVGEARHAAMTASSQTAFAETPFQRSESDVQRSESLMRDLS
ncbi:hypothetical protein IP85_08345 [Rhizobium sp. AAP116]|nr:hypothetical protein IP85_08345 [Rhizobium sp. AAP116]